MKNTPAKIIWEHVDPDPHKHLLLSVFLILVISMNV